MKLILLTAIVTSMLMLSVSAEPGGVYTLTGQEKSIEEIVKADMKQYPELYKGQSFSFYLLDFKKANNLENRKLSPGDTLVFPETKASIRAKLEPLSGTWIIEKEITDGATMSVIPGAKMVETLTLEMNGKYSLSIEMNDPSDHVRSISETYSGTWELRDRSIWCKKDRRESDSKFKTSAVFIEGAMWLDGEMWSNKAHPDWIIFQILSQSETTLHTRVGDKKTERSFTREVE